MNGLLNIHPKVAGGSFSGALALIILWGASYAITVPTNVAAAFAVVLTGLGAYLSPVLKREAASFGPVASAPPADSGAPK